MKKIQVGQKVKLATMEHLEFEVTEINSDGSCQIEAQLDERHVLQYGDIAVEMLGVIEKSSS